MTDKNNCFPACLSASTDARLSQPVTVTSLSQGVQSEKEKREEHARKRKSISGCRLADENDVRRRDRRPRRHGMPHQSRRWTLLIRLTRDESLARDILLLGVFVCPSGAILSGSD